MLWAKSEVCLGSAFSATDDIDPVQGMQVVKVHHVILQVLGAKHQVADHFGIRRNLDPQGVLHGADRGQRMHGGTDTTGPFGKGPGVARVPAFQDQLEAADHGS